MAIRYAVASGNWSNTATWNGGTLPTSADDVYSNTFTVTIDVSPTVLSISNASASGVTAGGSFTINAGNITLTCSAAVGIAAASGLAPTLTVNNSISTSVSIVANLRQVAGSGAVPVNFSGAGTLTVTGNIGGGDGGATSPGLNVSGSGICNITGTLTGGAFGAGAQGVAVIVSGTGSRVNITGDVYGRPSGALFSYGLSITGSNVTASVIGTVYAGGSSSSSGINIGSVSNLDFTHTGAVFAGNIGAGINSAAGTALRLSGPFYTSSVGASPLTVLVWKWSTPNPNTFYQVRSSDLTSIVNLYTASNPDSGSGQPAAANVRSGTVYGPANELTGTCAVPGAASVMIGVPVDNTVGTAAISASDIKNACSKAIVPALLALG